MTKNMKNFQGAMFLLRIADNDSSFRSGHKFENANNCGHFKIYDQNKFHALELKHDNSVITTGLHSVPNSSLASTNFCHLLNTFANS